MYNKKKNHSIILKIFKPTVILSLIQIIVLITVFFVFNIGNELKQNSFDVVNERNKNRTAYFEREMLTRWSNLNIFEEQINNILKRQIENKKIELKNLSNDSDDYNIFLTSVSEVIIDAMRSNTVTGGFIVLNSEYLNADLESGDFKDKPGIYIRDLDPTTNASLENNDLLLMRSPVETYQKLNLAMDSSWKANFIFGQQTVKYYDWLYKPYDMALIHRNYDIKNLGYWSKGYNLYGDNESAISYSIPLVYDDGTVYGVFGIEITEDYIDDFLPYDELLDGNEGSYILAIYDKESGEYTNILSNGEISKKLDKGKSFTLSELNSINDAYSFKLGDDNQEYYCSVQNLNIYNNNTPFEKDDWKLIAVVNKGRLFNFADHINFIIIGIIIFFIILGFAGVFIISIVVSKPIIKLSEDLKTSNRNKTVILPKTNVIELDELAVEIENLSNEMLDYSNKLSNILDMSSRKIGAFENDIVKGRLFITENFFRIFNDYKTDVNKLNNDTFFRKLTSLDKYIEYKTDDLRSDNIYKLTYLGAEIWVSLKTTTKDSRWIGLAEDITSEMLEKKQLEKERDQDVLTELLNRRAFYRKVEYLFEYESDSLKTAIFLMLDLDSLKYVNDTYGHDTGDLYIKCMAESLIEVLPGDAIISRLSGDEFIVLLYGYDTKDEIRTLVREMKNELNNRKIVLSNNQDYFIRFSAGISWYPDDSRDIKLLMKYVDFAMYKIKNSSKGRIGEFNKEVYDKESYILSCKEELNELIEKELFNYNFQPILSAKTGEVFGYESFMRADVPNLDSPDKILLIAQKEFKMEQIEYLTFKFSMSKYVKEIENGKISSQKKIFINSLPNYSLTEEQLIEFEKMYSKYLHNIVVEITEQQRMNDYIINHKKGRINTWGAQIALDDFGSGFSNHISMLKTKPDYIKIDLSIISGIDTDVNKQNVVESVVQYGHKRDMKFIAEGIENYNELKKVIELDIDYIQGYYCGKPSSEIYEIDSNIIEEINTLSK